jgi:hypothetical protein
MNFKENSQSDHSTKPSDDEKRQEEHLIQKISVSSTLLSSFTRKTLTLYKLAMLFFGITALIPNAVILSDMDFFIYKV